MGKWQNTGAVNAEQDGTQANPENQDGVYSTPLLAELRRLAVSPKNRENRCRMEGRVEPQSNTPSAGYGDRAAPSPASIGTIMHKAPICARPARQGCSVQRVNMIPAAAGPVITSPSKNRRLPRHWMRVMVCSVSRSNAPIAIPIWGICFPTTAPTGLRYCINSAALDFRQ